MLHKQYLINDFKKNADIVRIIQSCIGVIRLFYVFALISISGLISVAQDIPAPILIDSFEQSSCGDYMARSDYFGMELQKAPSSRGVLVWYGEGDETADQADRNALFMHRMLINRFGNSLKVTVLRSTDKPKLRGEAWLVPRGGELSFPNSRIVAEIPFTITKRTLYAESDSGSCSNYDQYGFANALLNNPTATGVIVNVSSTRSKSANDAEEILNLFRELKVPRNRIRLFYKLMKRSPVTELDYWEMWVVPAKH
jgi:hypothetical protein